MAHAVEQWHEVLLQQMPRGRAWPRDPESNTSKYVRGFAKRLADCEVSAGQLYLEMRPETAVQLLPDWEEYLGLPECAVPNQTFESRRAAVVEKYHRKGGLQTWQIEALALALGFTVEVREHFPHHVLRPVTYPIWPNRWRYALEVVVFGFPDGRFRVTDTVITPLKTQTALLLECTLSRYKLGGFTYEFVYEV
jgi:uncharacterized protein YmfQ (DUF2313 family)